MTTSIAVGDTMVHDHKMKPQRFSKLFDAAETKRTLLKLVNYDSPVPAPVGDPIGHEPTKVWWPSVKRVLSLRRSTSLGNTRANRRPFAVDEEDLSLQCKIGEGLHSDVYAGRLGQEGQKVAVKQLRSICNTKDMERSAQILHDFQALSSKLRHPYIVEFIGVNMDLEQGIVNLVFEHMGGGTLEEFFESTGFDGQLPNLPLLTVLSYSKQMFQGLQFLHDREVPIIHRDLKPCNLMLSADLKTLKMRDFGVGKTTDFGLKIFGAANPNVKTELKTDLSKLYGPSSKGYTGTARYMAPEINPQAKRASYTTAVDIYSGGLIMWFMLEGQRPWERHHGSVAFSHARKGRRPPLCRDNSTYPLSMAALIGRAWSQDYRQRPAATEVLAVLDYIEEEVAGGGRRSCMMPIFRRSLYRVHSAGRF